MAGSAEEEAPGCTHRNLDRVEASPVDGEPLLGSVQRPSPRRRLRIAFLHPDLGLGGAERLIVDAAAELAARQHAVDIYTPHYDPHRCFAETRSGAFRVLIAGALWPRNVLGLLHALCACIRCLIAALCIALRSWREGLVYDAVIVDQVAAVVPLIKWLLRGKVVFYCHFPDLLLATRGSAVRRLYRMPLDWLEEVSTGQADLLFVNSHFTQQVFGDTFKRLHAKGCVPRVLYPAVSIPTSEELLAANQSWPSALSAEASALARAGPVFLSINRFERKKGIALAVLALKEFLDSRNGERPSTAGLIIAGGYDIRVRENVEHLKELQLLVKQLQLDQKVCFLPSFTDRQRACLLAACTAVLYTPQREHFGIVPLEAMAAGVPVIACSSGGPVETIDSGATGYLCEPTPRAFASAMQRLVGRSAQMGTNARARVQERFCRAKFGDRLEQELNTLTAPPQHPLPPVLAPPPEQE